MGTSPTKAEIGSTPSGLSVKNKFYLKHRGSAGIMSDRSRAFVNSLDEARDAIIGPAAMSRGGPGAMSRGFSIL